MPSINAPSIARRLLQEYGIRGDFVPFLAPDLVPVVLIDDLVARDPQDVTFRPEAWGFRFISGAAGERGYAQIRNPAGSGIILKVSSLRIGVDTTNRVEVSEYGTQLSAPTFGGWQDQSLPSAPLAELCALSTIGALGTQRWVAEAGAGGGAFVMSLEATLAEGQGLIVSAITNQQLIRSNWIWSEELAPD